MSRDSLSACAFVTALLLISGTGCGPAGPANSVAGKVTLGGQPVRGTIVFRGADGKEATAPVGPTGGTYAIADPPVGEVTILVKGDALAVLAPPPTLPGAPAAPDMTNAVKTGSATVPPPAKYADASGGLKYTVKAGRQTHDIELTP